MEHILKTSGKFESFDGTSIYFETHGEGEPLVFVYGIACLMNHWHHQIEYFSKTHQVICFDIRGHHKSAEGHLKNLKMSDLAKDIAALLKHLRLPQAHFFGHSFGAPLLLELYDQNPGIFKSICFINGFSKNPIKGMFGLDVVEPFFFFMKAQHEKQPELWNTLWRMAVDNPVTMQLTAMLGGFNINVVQFKDIEVYVRGVARMDLGLFIKLFEELMVYNGEGVLPKINVPTLIISGEKDMVTPQRFQHEFHEKIKNSELLIVPYGSHCTQLDFPDYINLRIEKFLGKI